MLLHPDTLKHFGLVVDTGEGPQYLQCLRLAMGLKQAPALFSCFTGLIREIMEHQALEIEEWLVGRQSAGNASSEAELLRQLREHVSLHRSTGTIDYAICKVLFYVDDLIMRLASKTAETARMGAQYILRLLNLRTNDKGQLNTPHGCSERITALGLQVDSSAMRLTVDYEKLYTTMTLGHVLASVGDSRFPHLSLPLERLDSFIGRMAWLARHVPGGWLLMSELYQHSSCVKAKGYRHAKSALCSVFTGAWGRWCQLFKREELNGFSPISLSQLTSTALRVDTLSDASGNGGWGAVVQGKVLSGHLAKSTRGWQPEKGQNAPWHIDARELMPIVAMCDTFGAEWTGKLVAFSSDNMGNCYALNKGKASSVRARQLLERIYAAARRHNFQFIALWLPRERNTLCDQLSKTPDSVSARSIIQGHPLVYHRWEEPTWLQEGSGPSAGEGSK